MKLYIENPKDSTHTHKVLDLMQEFGKVAGNKINIQKSVAFLYTKNELSESETRKTIHLLLQQKHNKVPRNIYISSKFKYSSSKFIGLSN